MASFRKHRGKWQARIFNSATNKTRSKSFTTRKAAADWAREAEADLINQADPHYFPPLRNLIERYRNEVTPRKRGARQEDQRLRYWQDSVLANQPANELRSEQLATWRDEALCDRSDATVRQYLIVLSNVFRHARLEWGLTKLQNPTKQIALPRPNNGRDRRLLPGEFEAVLDELPPEMKLLAQLCRWTGMRMSEGQQLRWEDVDLEARTAILHQTKNGSRRVVPLGPEAVELLTNTKATSENIVPEIANPSAAWRRATKRAQRSHTGNGHFCDDLHFHDLRHERTSELFELGLDVTEVALVTGHKSLSMLMGYTHHKASKIAIKLNL
jgi:integrase